MADVDIKNSANLPVQQFNKKCRLSLFFLKMFTLKMQVNMFYFDGVSYVQ